MKNRTLLAILLTIGFVGATSCGQDNTSQQLAQENAALRAALAQRAALGTTGAPGTTVTQVQTTVVNQTVTNGSVNNSVVYTVTSNNANTATVRQ